MNHNAKNHANCQNTPCTALIGNHSGVNGPHEQAGNREQCSGQAGLRSGTIQHIKDVRRNKEENGNQREIHQETIDRQNQGIPILQHRHRDDAIVTLLTNGENQPNQTNQAYNQKDIAGGAAKGNQRGAQCQEEADRTQENAQRNRTAKIKGTRFNSQFRSINHNTGNNRADQSAQAVHGNDKAQILCCSLLVINISDDRIANDIETGRKHTVQNASCHNNCHMRRNCTKEDANRTG